MNAKEINIKDYAESLGAKFVNYGGTFKTCCLFHNEKTPSMAYNPATNKLRCFGGCGKSWDVINLCQELNGISYGEAKDLLEGRSSQKFTNKPFKKVDIAKQKEAQRQEDQKKKRSLWIARKFAKPLEEEERQYLESRGILKIVDRLNASNLPIKVKCNEYNGIKSILYMYEGKNLIIKKHYRKADRDAHKVPKALNIGYGQPSSIIINKNDNRVCILEGIEDALSSLTMGRNAIALNGVSNVKQCLEGFKKGYKWAKEKIFVIIMDNDEAGRKAQKELIAGLEALGLNYEIPLKLFEEMDAKGFKDLNEYHIDRLKERKGN